MATRSGNGFGPNPVSMSDIWAYVELTGPPYLEGSVFVEMLVSMDQKYLELTTEKKIILPEKHGRSR